MIKKLLKGYVPLHSLKLAAISRKYSQASKLKYTPVYFEKSFELYLTKELLPTLISGAISHKIIILTFTPIKTSNITSESRYL
jgi:hypothetical protein